MKRLPFFLVFFFMSVTLLAQTYLDVTPGYGTLNAAIAANQGNVIYRLQAGGWYGLNAIISNAGFNLTIVGTTPANSTTMKAEIQTGSDATGVPFVNMFQISQNLTLKNLFIVDANSNNVQAGSFLIAMLATATVTIDSCVFDPLSITNQLLSAGSSTFPRAYFTNNLLLRSGQETDPNDGALFEIGGATGNGWDTLYVENNTFVNSGTWTVTNDNFTSGVDHFVWFNHNTFLFHKSQLFWSWYSTARYFTNNLLYDFNTQPWVMAWNAFFPDGSAIPETDQSRFSLISADTLMITDTTTKVTSYETFPSVRKDFVEYNLDYTNPNILSIPAWGQTHTLNNDGVTPIPLSYLMPLVQPVDSIAVSREAQMFNDHKNFPGFMYGNESDNVDPKWSQPVIYQLEDSLIAWSLIGCQVHTWGWNPALLPPTTAWPKYWFNADTNGLGNPTAWPRFDGTYTNKQVLTSSIEGMPLGDLNWFPTQKALWLANQKAIMSHILSENTAQMSITGVTKSNNKIPYSFALSQNYPNPFNPTTMIQYSIAKSGPVTLKVYNVIGQVVATLVNQQQQAGNYTVNFNANRLASGIYMYRIESGSFSSTKKMTYLK
ncbi:MAG: T9SS type A sorting domain-containing protein [Ignavibacteriaceae bacterium]